MPQGLAFIIVAIVISAAGFWLIETTYTAGQHRSLLTLLVGLMPMALLFLIDQLRRPQQVGVAEAAIGGATAVSGTTHASATRIPIVILVMTLSYVAFHALSQGLVWALEDTMQRLGTQQVSGRALSTIALTVQSYLSVLSHAGLIIVAFLVGMAGARLKYWYFVLASLLSAYILFLPRLAHIDPAKISLVSVMEMFSGVGASAFRGGAAGDLPPVAMQSILLLAIGFGLPLLWLLAACAGHQFRHAVKH